MHRLRSSSLIGNESPKHGNDRRRSVSQGLFDQIHHRENKTRSISGISFGKDRQTNRRASLAFISPMDTQISNFDNPTLPPHHHFGPITTTGSSSPSIRTPPSSRHSSIYLDQKLPTMEFSKDTPLEMVPILTLLQCQRTRIYYEGYFMLLADLNADGKPGVERRWVEVYCKLTGNVLSIWDADALNSANDQGEPTPNYINITDSSFKSIATLPSPSGDLSNIIVLSTTMKNRYLLQFSTQKLLHEWTAAMRLSVFEYSCLQEAYTGALLSSKGSQLNGVRTLLAETKFRHEDWVRVRFGAGMPWKKCWTVITPRGVKKKKDQPPPGTICFYEDDKKKTRKMPLAVITSAWCAYAVYPEKSILVNGSTLIKIGGTVEFADAPGDKETFVFLMPEQHPGVLGFETLIRFLIPTLDVFQLYGRPQRLNADKGDMRSLLFGMPSLPRTKYLEVLDLVMLVGLSGSDRWSSLDWTKNVKELLARKIATGYKGAGNLQTNDDSASEKSVVRQRPVSNPPPANLINNLSTPRIGGEDSSSNNSSNSSLAQKQTDPVSPNVSNGLPITAMRQAPSAPVLSGPQREQQTPRQPQPQQQPQQAAQSYSQLPSQPQSAPRPPAQNQPDRSYLAQDNNGYGQKDQYTNPSEGHSALRGPPIRVRPSAMGNASPANGLPKQLPSIPGAGPNQGGPRPPAHGGRYMDKAPAPLNLQPPLVPRHQEMRAPRSASMGTDPNNLMGQITKQSKPISPLPGADAGATFPERGDERASSRLDIRNDIFDDPKFARQPDGNLSAKLLPNPTQGQKQSQSPHRVPRRPVSGEMHPPPPPPPAQIPNPPAHVDSSYNSIPRTPVQQQNMFDPTYQAQHSYESESASSSPRSYRTAPNNSNANIGLSTPTSPTHRIRPHSPYYRTASGNSVYQQPTESTSGNFTGRGQPAYEPPLQAYNRTRPAPPPHQGRSSPAPEYPAPPMHQEQYVQGRPSGEAYR